MKRKISVLLLCVVLAFSLAACGGGNAAVKDRMDVQQLWKDATGQDGYPQASLVVKSELAQSSGDFLNAFLETLSKSDNWAADNPDAAVEAVKAHMQEGSASTITSLSSEIVERCNIKTVFAAQAKESVEKLLTGFLSMEEEAGSSLIGGKLPDADFYFTPQSGGEVPSNVKVFMPDGATALSFAKMMRDNGEVGGTAVDYSVVTANTIASKLTSSEADIAIVPTNLAAKLYNANGKYKMIATVTNGNLYIIGGESEGLSSLAGKRVASIGQGAVPDIIFRYLLQLNNIEYTVSDRAVEGKVALTYFADGGAVIKAIKGGLAEFGLLGEPAATNAYAAINS